ncbi:MAG TPA: hypothetical protein VF534_09675, partial [Paraburkholderia sp.]
ARADAKLALVVVLPTPPLPEVTTMIFAITLTLCSSNSSIMCGHICREAPRAVYVQGSARFTSIR